MTEPQTMTVISPESSLHRLLELQQRQVGEGGEARVMVSTLDTGTMRWPGSDLEVVLDITAPTVPLGWELSV
jgi:hypothetical protein